MSTYGLKYSCPFDSKATTYTLEIYQKDYVGSVIPVTGGASVVRHSWATDEPKPPIKGSSLAATLINESANISLADLYSTDDEEFKAILVWHTGVTDINLFEGFVVQDDSSEPMVDYNHDISISANDNLGLLKDIPFNKAFFQLYTLSESYSANVTGFAPNQIVRTTSGSTIEEGDKIVISGGSGLDGTYIVQSVAGTTGSANIYVRETISSVGTVSVTFAHYKPDFYTLRSLNSFVKSCLLSTGLELDTQEFVNLNEVTQTTDCFFDQTYLDPQTFNNGSSWDDCYTVLEKIFDRFDCTLFQAKGKWNIIRWPELRDFDYSIAGFLYDEDFVFQNAVYLDENRFGFAGWPKWQIGIGEETQAETGLQRRIRRAFKFTKETFNYRQPEQLLRNANLQQLGNFITSYADGPNTVYEYKMPWWDTITESMVGPSDFFIRVVQDSLGNELERYAVVKVVSIECTGIQVNEGDKFTYSFSFETADSQPGNLNIILGIKVLDGVQTKYMDEDGIWQTGPGYTYNIPAGDNSNIRHTVEITGTIPFDGLLYLTLTKADQSGTDNGTYYRDIRFEYTPLINQSTKIIGHTHTSDQKTLTKNKDEKEIFIDVSPRNSIAGTLFLSTSTGVLRDRCGQWNRATRTEAKNLGEITTEENEFIRRIPRTLLEGTFYGLISPPEDAGGIDIVDHLSIIAVIRYTLFADKNFIFGRMEIDYKNDNASGTLYEMYQDAEVDADLTYYYTFQYLYATK